LKKVSTLTGAYVAFKSKISLLGIWAATFVIFSGCSESEFKGSSSGASASVSTEPQPGGQDAEPSQEPNNTPTNNTDDCVDGDKLDIKFESKIQKCIDDGKLYNFDSKVCTTMPPATFKCSFTTVLKELAERDLTGSKLDSAKANGDKLVGCGQSPDGNTIVAQWIKVPKTDSLNCNSFSSGSGITTGCYKKYTSGNIKPLNTDDEKRKFVLDCMNGKE
jgi:hypothetical protein